MTGPKPPKPSSAKEETRKAREARLAAALRANLRRRKSASEGAGDGGKNRVSKPPRAP